MESVWRGVREMDAQKNKNNLQKQNKPKKELESKKIDVNQVGFTESKNKKLGFEDRVSGGVRELARVWWRRKGESAIPMESVSCGTKEDMVSVKRIVDTTKMSNEVQKEQRWNFGFVQEKRLKQKNHLHKQNKTKN